MRYERLILAVFLLTVSGLAFLDIYNDYFEGVALWHIGIELVVAIISLIWGYYLIRTRIRLQRALHRERQFSSDLKTEAQKWKRVSRIYLEGLSREIDEQLNRWGLTEAEKEVAFLLLKGFSATQIARIRKTSVKTVRTQMNAIYSKSGLSGRSELTAFFLEDLLLPRQ
ncbi:MAG: response regulator transcription factor [Calditrichaeota bacterium]|nr:response regulator transcription factor [Calditrichota bacterium]